MNNAFPMSIDAISLCAYAKINIHLKVLEKRPDGFHNLESIFQRISIADYLSVIKSDGTDRCIVESPLMDLPEDNTIAHAWDVFQQAAAIKSGIKVRLIKNIPAGSGLGGGSSDAAALLRAVNELFEVNFSYDALHDLAVQIGSDVPFFLEETAGLVAGRGEAFKPLEPRMDCFGILIWPDTQSSTKEAYWLLDQARDMSTDSNAPWGDTQLQEHYYAPLHAWQFVNDFQAVLEVQHPAIAQACADLCECGASFVRMTGAGSAVFGLFERNTAMASAFTLLQKKWSWCKSFILLA